jgi:hypothetical protein
MRARRLFFAGSAAVILGGPLLVFACNDDGVPPGVIYGFDTPPGGRLVNPGIVACGGAQCEVRFGGLCCAGPGVAGGGQCFDAGLSCPPGTGEILCNEKADCKANQSCCASPPSSGGYLTAACALSCTGAQIQLCRTNGECPGGACVIQKCSDGIVYEVCGLSTSAGFACDALSADGGLELDGDAAIASDH